MGMFGKKLTKQFVDLFALKKPKNCVLEKLENKTFAEKLFHSFSTDKISINLC
jgi:NAD-dependent DNA ligase